MTDKLDVPLTRVEPAPAPAIPPAPAPAPTRNEPGDNPAGKSPVLPDRADAARFRRRLEDADRSLYRY